MKKDVPPLIAPAPEDRRFKDMQWDEDHVFSFIKEYYLLTARHLQATVNQVQGLDEHTAQKAAFYARQVMNAVLATNFSTTPISASSRCSSTKSS